MPKISKQYKTIKQAESYQNRLYNKHHYVRLIQFPALSESGTYVWEVASIEERLEHLRGEIRAQRISYDGMAELQGLAKYIKPGDVELAEPAGIPEEEFVKRPG